MLADLVDIPWTFHGKRPFRLRSLLIRIAFKVFYLLI
jgi:hypothetical protein